MLRKILKHRIFLSYRASDIAIAMHVKRVLDRHLGTGVVFIDKEIEFGERWGDILQKEVSNCWIFIPIVTKNYFGPRSRADIINDTTENIVFGEQRKIGNQVNTNYQIERSDDFVRKELEWALSHEDGSLRHDKQRNAEYENHPINPQEHPTTPSNPIEFPIRISPLMLESFKQLPSPKDFEPNTQSLIANFFDIQWRELDFTSDSALGAKTIVEIQNVIEERLNSFNRWNAFNLTLYKIRQTITSSFSQYRKPLSLATVPLLAAILMLTGLYFQKTNQLKASLAEKEKNFTELEENMLSQNSNSEQSMLNLKSAHAEEISSREIAHKEEIKRITEAQTTTLATLQKTNLNSTKNIKKYISISQSLQKIKSNKNWQSSEELGILSFNNTRPTELLISLTNSREPFNQNSDKRGRYDNLNVEWNMDEHKIKMVNKYLAGINLSAFYRREAGYCRNKSPCWSGRNLEELHTTSLDILDKVFYGVQEEFSAPIENRQFRSLYCSLADQYYQNETNETSSRVKALDLISEYFKSSGKNSDNIFTVESSTCHKVKAEYFLDIATTPETEKEKNEAVKNYLLHLDSAINSAKALEFSTGESAVFYLTNQLAHQPRFESITPAEQKDILANRKLALDEVKKLLRQDNPKNNPYEYAYHYLKAMYHIQTNDLHEALISYDTFLDLHAESL